MVHPRRRWSGGRSTSSVPTTAEISVEGGVQVLAGCCEKWVDHDVPVDMCAALEDRLKRPPAADDD